MAKTPQQIAEKWSNNLQNAGQSIRDGINAVQEAPSQKAIAAKQKMITNWQNSMNDGTWEAGLQKVTLADWKNAMINKGLSRIASGAVQGQSKMAAYMSEAMPYIETVKAEIDKMPNLTLQHSIDRAAHMIRRMSEFKKSK